MAVAAPLLQDQNIAYFNVDINDLAFATYGTFYMNIFTFIYAYTIIVIVCVKFNLISIILKKKLRMCSKLIL